ncbi:hypothetical protein [Phaeobacter inhibens]|uniref:hypothetical protein n=1 Tax=Phaeobacter inhibens TaxID=221822 RepID=UPI00076BBDA0|nr:hypothetical protein [Phaeobacter inhibens]KXF89761.1 hypothetical protein AT574_14225 [Phaeobacter inhibens]WHP69297.1 hypothetical protein QMZ01_03665 [Phaeobacter inhibens]
MARRSAALLGILVALQDRFNPIVMTIGAKVVNWLYTCWRSIDGLALRGLPQFVSDKLLLTAFQLDHFVAEISYRLTKSYIRLARVHYLFVQRGYNRPDIIHWRRLSRLKQRLEAVNCAYGRRKCRGAAASDVDCLLRGVYVEIHKIAFWSNENSEYRLMIAAAKAEKQGEASK